MIDPDLDPYEIAEGRLESAIAAGNLGNTLFLAGEEWIDRDAGRIARVTRSREHETAAWGAPVREERTRPVDPPTPQETAA